MTITSTIASLQTINSGITGIALAPVAYPGSLQTADLPMALVWPGESQQQRRTVGETARMDRQYRILVYLAPLTLGVFPSEEVTNGIVLLQRFMDTYVNTTANIVQDADGRQITITTGPGDQSDTGILVLTYAGTDYHGFEYRVRVTEKW